MELEIIILSEVSQTKTISYDITYMWNLKYDTNELTYETEIDSDVENRLVAKGKVGGRWGEGGGEMEWELGLSRCKL